MKCGEFCVVLATVEAGENLLCAFLVARAYCGAKRRFFSRPSVELYPRSWNNKKV
jgi:hypothetical protein